MSLPKKKQGFRTITFEGKRFYWRFSGKIDIRPELQKNNKLVVDFGWFDEWLYVNDKENRPPDFEPKTVTAEFVSKAIQFALDNKWDIDKKSGILELIYNGGHFKIGDSNSKMKKEQASS